MPPRNRGILTTVDPLEPNHTPPHSLGALIITAGLLLGYPTGVFADENISIPFVSPDILELIEGESDIDVSYDRLSEREREATAAAKRHIPRPPKPSIARSRPTLIQSGTHSVVATAYSSTPDQTDSDPCTTANGFNVCKHNRENVIAANYLAFGTRVRLPELYGDRVFVVQDRMNARYGNGRIDLWMKTRGAAKQFGVKRTTLEVVDDRLAANNETTLRD